MLDLTNYLFEFNFRTMNITLSIVDDHPMIISGLQNMLSNHKHISVISTYYNGTKLLEGLQKLVPDILLLDIQMPGLSGDDLAPVLLKQYPGLGIIALTNFDNAIYVNAFLQYGVQGYLLKTTSPETLISAIETVAKGGQFIDPDIKEKVKQLALMKKNIAMTPLTLREKEVLQLIVNGVTTKEIANSLFLSFYTVENYRAKILNKLDVKNVAELTKKALILGLVK